MGPDTLDKTEKTIVLKIHCNKAKSILEFASKCLYIR